MDFLAPTTWADALAAKAEQPDAVPVAGGTDVMVEINFDHRRPPALLDLTRVPELREWATDGDLIRLGAGVTYSRIITELGATLPGLAMASRTVGSPQIRNRGTVGGNLGAASPAGDSHPALLAADAIVEVASVRGIRADPGHGVLHRGQAQRAGPRRADLRRADPAGGWAAAVLQDRHAQRDGDRRRRVRDRAAPRPPRDRDGHRLGRAHPAHAPPRPPRSWPARSRPPGCGTPAASCPRASPWTSAAASATPPSPIDDVRGSAAYRLHSLSVMARRAATWAWDEFRTDDRRAA